MPSAPELQLPSPTPELRRALQFSHFADGASMLTLQAELTSYARALRACMASQAVVERTIRAVVDDSLPTRAVPIRTSEDRTRLLTLAAEWCAAPVF
jgi:hypothetical protein